MRKFTKKISLDTPEIQAAVDNALNLWGEDASNIDSEISSDIERLTEAFVSLLSVYSPFAPPDIKFKWHNEEWHRPGGFVW